MRSNPTHPRPRALVSLAVLPLWLAACESDPAATTVRHVIATISATPGALLADGAASAKVEVRVTWTDGTPADGFAVELRSSRNQADRITPVQGQTDDQGLWQSSLSSSTAGESILTLFSGDDAVCSDDLEQCHPAQVKVTFTDKPVPVPVQCVAKLAGSIAQLTSTAGKTSYPALAATTEGQLVVAYDEDDSAAGAPFYGKRQVFVGRFDDKGAPLGQPVAISSGEEAYRPRIVAVADGHALVYTREASGNATVMFARLKGDGSLQAAPTTIVAGQYSLPAIARPEKGFGVALTGKAAAGDGSTTWFVPLDDAGAPGKPVQVATKTSADTNLTYPQIATDGKVFAVAWQDRRNGSWDVFFRLVKPDGSFASDELTVRTDLESVSVAVQLVWTGTEYGAVFADTRKEYGHFQIYLARIAADGSKVTSEHAISSAAENADTPGLAFSGGNYWISWIEKPWCGDAVPFAVKASSPVIDNGADLGMAFTGAGPDIGAVEFGLPFGSTSSLTTSVHLAQFDPVRGQIASQIKIADNKGFSAFPVIQVIKDRLRLVWFDEPGQQRDLFSATVTCESR